MSGEVSFGTLTVLLPWWPPSSPEPPPASPPPSSPWLVPTPQPPHRASSPPPRRAPSLWSVVNDVDAHGNEPLFDSLTFKLPQDHAGPDLLRSKSLDRNSDNSGDWFNVLDVTKTDNGFGRGLPPAGDNRDKWDLIRPLLADPSLKPEPADIEQASAMAADLLRLRFSTELFLLGDPDLIEQKVSFPVSGTGYGDPQVVVLRIDDTVGTDVDPGPGGVLVVFNASDEDVEQVMPGLAGAELELSPVRADGADPVVRHSTWDGGTGTAHVPAPTVWRSSSSHEALGQTGPGVGKMGG